MTDAELEEIKKNFEILGSLAEISIQGPTADRAKIEAFGKLPEHLNALLVEVERLRAIEKLADGIDPTIPLTEAQKEYGRKVAERITNEQKDKGTQRT